MFMERQLDPSPKAIFLLLRPGNRIRYNIQPSLAKHEVLLVGVCTRLVDVQALGLHCGKQNLIEQGLTVGVSMPVMTQSLPSSYGHY
jgi:hypothetical protein